MSASTDARPTQSDAPVPPRSSEWRGVAAEHRDDDLDRGSPRRCCRRGPAGCCGDLLRPHKRLLWVLLVDRAGRERRPALDPLPRQGGHRPRHPADPGDGDDLGRCSRSWRSCCVATVVQAITRQLLPGASPAGSARTCSSSSGAGCSGTSSGSARPSTTSYTSGRVISRQTSDIDAIYEMLETGFDGLVTAAAHAGRHRRPAARRSTSSSGWSRCCASRSWLG